MLIYYVIEHIIHHGDLTIINHELFDHINSWSNPHVTIKPYGNPVVSQITYKEVHNLFKSLSLSRLFVCIVLSLSHICLVIFDTWCYLYSKKRLNIKAPMLFQPHASRLSWDIWNKWLLDVRMDVLYEITCLGHHSLQCAFINPRQHAIHGHQEWNICGFVGETSSNFLAWLIDWDIMKIIKYPFI